MPTATVAAESTVAAPQLDRRRMHQVVWGSFLVSRLLVLASGAVAMIEFGLPSGLNSSYYAGLTIPGGYAGSLLFATAARWDASWYASIARWGYAGSPYRSAYFPLYPLLMRVLGWLVGSQVVAGTLISVVCFPAALFVLYRLICLDFSEDVAAGALLLLAFFPMAVFFSAIYTESLFLLLSVATMYAARRGRWLTAALMGFLASATRNTGVLLLVPVLLMMLYGPCEDGARRPGPFSEQQRRGWRVILPKYRIPRLGYAVVLIPCGMLLYLVYLQARWGLGSAPFRVESAWYHKSMTPVEGLWKSIVAGWNGLRQVLHGPAPPAYINSVEGEPLIVGLFDLVMLVFLIPGLVGLVGVFRRQPLAYSMYALLGVLVPLSDPVTQQPLQSVSRYMMMLFPLFIWASERLQRRSWVPLALALAGSGMTLGISSALLGTWRFIG